MVNLVGDATGVDIVGVGVICGHVMVERGVGGMLKWFVVMVERKGGSW